MADVQRVSQWADEEDQQQPIIKTNADGTKTITTFRTNPEGKKIKITQRIKEVLVKEVVNKSIADRKKWKKFGSERDAAPGPDFRTTQVGEAVYLRLGTLWKDIRREEEEKAQEAAKVVNEGTIKCRSCGGSHFTSKCPFKDTLGTVDAAAGSGADDIPAAGVSPAASGKYVPVHLRNRTGAEGADRRGGDRDDSTTLRISQLNEMVDEQMLREELLFRFGPLLRVNIVRNKETGRSKGFAFVQFSSEQDAQNALDALNGRGYHSLILHLEFSKRRN